MLVEITADLESIYQTKGFDERDYWEEANPKKVPVDEKSREVGQPQATENPHCPRCVI